jgi:hypothetical protein
LAVLTAPPQAVSAGLLGRWAIPYIPAKTIKMTSAAAAETRRQRPIFCSNGTDGSVAAVVLGFGAGFMRISL